MYYYYVPCVLSRCVVVGHQHTHFNNVSFVVAHEYYYSLILIITFIYSFLLSTKYCSLLISIKEIPDMKKKLAELEQLQVFRQLYNRLKTGIVNIMIGPNQKDKEQSYEELRALLNVNPLGHSPSLSRYP